jgi:hypothetical protein
LTPGEVENPQSRQSRCKTDDDEEDEIEVHNCGSIAESKVEFKLALSVNFSLICFSKMIPNALP